MVGGQSARTLATLAAMLGGVSDADDAGLVVAIIGSDGAGKSTLCRDLAEEWHDRGPVDWVYFGSGDGPSSWLRWPLVKLRRVLFGTATAGQAAGRPPKGPAFAAEPRRGSVIAVARALWALTLASEKQAKLRSVRRARDRGHLIVCDRFPQAQVGGLMDGPLLHAWLERPRGARRRLARWRRVHTSAPNASPPTSCSG